MWKMRTLSEWRKAMNLPPRLGDLRQSATYKYVYYQYFIVVVRLWATRLHLYGDDEEEQKKISKANQVSSYGLHYSLDAQSDRSPITLGNCWFASFH